MSIVLFNSLGRKLQNFHSIKPGQVNMYCCGPTVYNFAHLGNLRTYLFEDVLRRTLEMNGYKVNHVMNITDVGHLTGDNLGDANTGEDKMEKASKREGKTAWQIAEMYTKAFFGDFKLLNIKMPTVTPKATDHIAEQIEMVEKLMTDGYAYKTADGIYFDVSKWAEYGKLSGQKLEDKKAGARIDVNDEKKNPQDFALWKFTPEDEVRQMEWDGPGDRKGFPGWHIECSAMSMKYLGKHFDIHCGGVDHIPIHHENEIAQSEAANHEPYVNVWMHGEFMMVDGRRMGKSEGNAFLVKDLIAKGYDPLAFRYLNLGTHYRIQLNFTWEAIDAAQTALGRLKMQVAKLRGEGSSDEEYLNRFKACLNNDLNSAEALSVVWEVLKSNVSDEDKLATVKDMDKVLGLNLTTPLNVKLDVSDEVKKMLDLRAKARTEKNFAESDRLRDQIAALGYGVKDGMNGQELTKL